jgi:hypothetical protein
MCLISYRSLPDIDPLLLNLEADIEKTTENAISKNSSIQLLKLGDNTITKDQWIFDFSFPNISKQYAKGSVETI